MSVTGYRIVFMGTPDFAVPSLQTLLDSHHHVVGVVTQPDKKKGRGKKLAPPPVKVVAQLADIPVLQPTKIRTDEFYATLRDYRPDLIIVAAYGRILPAEILNLPPLGCINVHGSLLPRHRGAAPIQWAIIEGDKRTGITIMQMDEGMDTGDILFGASIDIEENETAGSLFDRLAQLGATTLRTALAKLEKGELTPTKQDESQAGKAPPLQKEMGCIDWTLPAERLDCLIRGLDPWPCAYTFLHGKRYRIFSPRVVHKEEDEPGGTILAADRNGILVATGDKALLLEELQPEGKKRLTAASFLCGHSVERGSRFTNG